jgi:ribonucleoside-diphosphate reductase beta chain
VANSRDDSAQVDPGTLEDTNLSRVEPANPHRLYFLWETRHWAAGSFDFEQDRRDWAALNEDQRSLIIQSIAPFFAGEERVVATFAPIIISAEDDQEAAFLATQQVDEARHMQFFNRFWCEVLMPDTEESSKALAYARSRCNDAFTELFDKRLMQAVNRLMANPHDTDARFEAVTIYHLIVEGTMALTGLHFLLDYFEKNSLFPDIREGFRNVKRDEHLHVGWGTWYLRRKCREQERYGLMLQSTLMELLPIAASILVDSEPGPVACDGLDPLEFLDYPSAQVNHFALLGLQRRLKVIGGATEEIQQFVASGVWRAARLL